MLIVIRTPPHLRRTLCNEGPNVNNQQDDYFSAGMIFLSFLGKFNAVSYKNYGLKQYFKVIREIGSASSIYIYEIFPNVQKAKKIGCNLVCWNIMYVRYFYLKL